MTRYEQGFMRKCAEYGVNVETAKKLMKLAQDAVTIDAVKKDTEPRLEDVIDNDTGIRYKNFEIGNTDGPKAVTPEMAASLLDVPPDAISVKNGLIHRQMVGAPTGQTWLQYSEKPFLLNSSGTNAVDLALGYIPGKTDIWFPGSNVEDPRYVADRSTQTRRPNYDWFAKFIAGLQRRLKK